MGSVGWNRVGLGTQAQNEKHSKHFFSCVNILECSNLASAVRTVTVPTIVKTGLNPFFNTFFVTFKYTSITFPLFNFY